MANRFTLWKHAIADLERAIAELGQVRASLNDIHLLTIRSTGQGLNANVEELIVEAHGLLTELREAECDDCGHAIAMHGDEYGCEYDRGDVQMNTRDGGTVLAADGPCHCRWGLEEAKA